VNVPSYSGADPHRCSVHADYSEDACVKIERPAKEGRFLKKLK
ncbi:hypothetical protein Tco_0558089, partial [Tanacetum coccineum]